MSITKRLRHHADPADAPIGWPSALMVEAADEIDRLQRHWDETHCPECKCSLLSNHHEDDCELGREAERKSAKGHRPSEPMISAIEAILKNNEITIDRDDVRLIIKLFLAYLNTIRWKLVPKTPTEEMIVAGDCADTLPWTDRVYSYMLDAAPKFNAGVD